ncbi:MAG: hypothetical protein Q4F66_05500 [Clostridium sp.]|nr:hypothetical protein [Clostridium sp.]
MKKSKIALALVMSLGMTMSYGVKGNCAVYNGWENSNGYWYYYKNGSMCTGWQKDSGTWYYMNSDGTMKTGWLKDSGVWYYLEGNGAMKTGWVKDGGNWYYLYSSGAMATGWIKDGGAWYYMNSDGSMKTGVLYENGKQYYLNDNGSMRTGWYKCYDDELNIDGWFYAKSDGSAMTGWLEDGGKWYYLTEDGSLGSDILVGKYYVNKDGVWDTSGDNKVMVATSIDSFDLSGDDKNVLVKVLNNTDKTIKYSTDFTVEKYKDGEWVIISNTGSNDTSDIDVHPHSTEVAVTDFQDFRYKLNAGTYRLGAKVDGEYIYSEFNIVGQNPNTSEYNIKMYTSDHYYYMNETKSIPYTIKNYTSETQKIDGTYTIRKCNGYRWTKVDLKDTAFSDEVVELKPGEEYHGSFDLSNIIGDIEPDTYTISKEIGGKKVSAGFDFTNDNIVSIKSRGDSFWDDDRYVELVLTNNTDKDIEFGHDFKIERRNYNDGWEEVPFKDASFDEGKIVLKANEEVTEKIDLDKFDRDELGESCRIVKEIDGIKYYIPFYYEELLTGHEDK